MVITTFTVKEVVYYIRVLTSIHAIACVSGEQPLHKVQTTVGHVLELLISEGRLIINTIKPQYRYKQYY